MSGRKADKYPKDKKCDDDKHGGNGKRPERRVTVDEDLASISSGDEKESKFNAPSTSRSGRLSEKPKLDVHLFGSSVDNASLKSCSTVETDIDKQSSSTLAAQTSLMTSPERAKYFAAAEQVRLRRPFAKLWPYYRSDEEESSSSALTVETELERRRIKPLDNVEVQGRQRRHTAGQQSFESLDLQPGTSRPRAASTSFDLFSSQEAADEIDFDSDTPPSGIAEAKRKQTKTEKPTPQRQSLPRRLQSRFRTFLSTAMANFRSARTSQAAIRTDKKFGLKKGTDGAGTSRDAPKKEDK